MKYLVVCAYHLTGVSKEKGIPFSMPRCNVLSDYEQIESKNFQSRGLGLSMVELSVDEHFYNEFEREFDRQFKGYPVEMDLIMRLDRDGKNVVKGFASLKPQLSASSVPSSIVPPANKQAL